MTTVPPVQRSNIRGCILGGAIGDAMGAPIEFMSLDAIRQRWGPRGPASYVEVAGRRGFVTDDTQMTLWTTEGLIRAHNRAPRGVSNPLYVVWRSYLRWLHTQGAPADWVAEGDDWGGANTGWLIQRRELFDIQAPGDTCLSALRSGMPGGITVDGYPPGSSRSSWARLNTSKGCGRVMRVAPVGLLSGDPFEFACEIAALTHGHPSGYLAAGTFARIVGAVARGSSIADAVVAAGRELKRWPGHEEVLESLRAAYRMARDGGEPSAEAVESLGAGWVAEEALAIATYCSLTARDTRSALALAALHSGDSDSTAAMTGNILGAAMGVDALPADLVAGLELRELIDEVCEDFASHFVDGRQAYDLEKYPPN